MPQLDQRLVRLAEQRPPVGAGALIQRIESRIVETPVRRVSPALHPVRAMTMAAAVMLVFVGGVAVGHWSFGSVGLFEAAFGGADVWTTTADISVLAMVVAGASSGFVLLAGSLGLAWRWRRRRQIYRSSTDQGGIMETMEKTTQTFDSTERVLRINRWMAVALILALAALVGLAAWLLVDNVVASDYERAIEEHFAAQSAGDGPAVAALYTEDGVFVDANGTVFEGREQIARAVAGQTYFGLEKIELIDSVTNGSIVATAERATWSWATFIGISVVEFDGNLIKRYQVSAANEVFD